MVHVTLKPGESLKRHVVSVDVLFYVLEGSCGDGWQKERCVTELAGSVSS